MVQKSGIHQLRLVLYPVIYQVFCTIPGGFSRGDFEKSIGPISLGVFFRDKNLPDFEELHRGFSSANVLLQHGPEKMEAQDRLMSSNHHVFQASSFIIFQGRICQASISQGPMLFNFIDVLPRKFTPKEGAKTT